MCGKELNVITRRKCWGVDRVIYEDDQGRAGSIPTAWTNIEPPDAFVVVAAGRSFFRVTDLLELFTLLQGLSDRGLPGGVKQISP